MNRLLDTINRFIPNLEIKSRRAKLDKLPMFFNQIYEFEDLVINGNQYLVVKVQSKDLGPKDFKKHLKVFSHINKNHVVWFLKDLHWNKVSRMIENELNFVIDNKQVHLPVLNTSIKNSRQKQELGIELTGTSINMLIREILVGDLSGKNKTQIAEIMEITKMSAGRGLEPLIGNELCEDIKLKVSKTINFKDRISLWQFFKKNVGSPIDKTLYFNKGFQDRLPLSGISALSSLSMLADDNIETFATYKRGYKDQIKNEVEVIKDEATAKLELWNRQPILIKDNCINILDIFLVHNGENDERVQIELEELLKNEGLGRG